tara:strand:+ start:570 stop:1211 length:642 start_codon:yes stop_codon:yes gene_type:complete
MSVSSGCLKNTQNSFQLFGNKKSLQKGGKSCHGTGFSNTMTSLNNAASSGMGYSRAVGVPYQHVGGGGYSFDGKSAALAAEFRGSYPAYSSYQKPSQCGGKRKKRKSKKRRKSKKGGKRKKSRRRRRSKKKRGGKRRKSRRRSKKKRGGKRRKSRRKRRTGTLTTLGSPQMGGSTVSYSLGANNPQKPWALANNSYGLNEKSCFDNYNHFKKN